LGFAQLGALGSRGRSGVDADQRHATRDQLECATRRLTLAFSGPAAARYGEPARCKLKNLKENQVAAGSAATPC
jgi:hypothetical protein